MGAIYIGSSSLRRCFFLLASLEVKHQDSANGAIPGMGSLVPLRAALVVFLVIGLGGCFPGFNGTADRLEALYARSLARIPGEKRGAITRESEYLLGIKRLRRLYCNVGIGFHIQVLPDGKITGVHNENSYSKLFSVHSLI